PSFSQNCSWEGGRGQVVLIEEQRIPISHIGWGIVRISSNRFFEVRSSLAYILLLGLLILVLSIRVPVRRSQVIPTFPIRVQGLRVDRSRLGQADGLPGTHIDSNLIGDLFCHSTLQCQHVT